MSYDTLASKETLATLSKNLTDRGFLPEVVATGADALTRIKALIPAGASVMNGSSTTLSQIGFVDILKARGHGWNNLHDAIIAEKDPAKQAELRKHSVVSDVYLGSAHAIAETGEMIIASASGSQLPHLVFTSPIVILVVSTQKITKDLASAHARIESHVVPLEDARMKSVNMGGTVLAKEFVWKMEPAFMGRKIHVILVEEKLGF
jgi:L-lactate utilization protein LutB